MANLVEVDTFVSNLQACHLVFDQPCFVDPGGFAPADGTIDTVAGPEALDLIGFVDAFTLTSGVGGGGDAIDPSGSCTVNSIDASFIAPGFVLNLPASSGITLLP